MPDPIVLKKSTPEQTASFDWGSLTWFANREQGNSQDMTVGLCRLLPGQSNPRHYHPNCSEILVVMQGRIKHTLSEDSEAEMGPGDAITIEANTWHHATNIGDEEALLYIAFSSADRKTIGED